MQVICKMQPHPDINLSSLLRRVQAPRLLYEPLLAAGIRLLRMFTVLHSARTNCLSVFQILSES